MNIEYTGRQFEITPAVRKQVEHGLEKIRKIIGGTFDTHVILSVAKERYKAEITINIRNHPIVGAAEAAEMSPAIGDALGKIDRQAVKYKSLWRTKKRRSGKSFVEEDLASFKRHALVQNGNGASMETTQAENLKTITVGPSPVTAVAVVVHSFPAVVKMTEAHVVKSDDSVALRPMTLEEAVKEAEFRDREVFVFRDHQGNVKVLHRKKDGKLELIEAP